jgi:hypothetical protein
MLHIVESILFVKYLRTYESILKTTLAHDSVWQKTSGPKSRGTFPLNPLPFNKIKNWTRRPN